MFDRFRAYGNAGQVLASGKADAQGRAVLDVGKAEFVERVVFYAGPLKSEVVVGSVRVNRKGPTAVEFG